MNILHSCKMFLPMLGVLAVFVIFQLVTPYFLHDYGFFDKNYQGITNPTLLKSGMYSGSALFIVLFLMKIFVVSFAVFTMKCRKHIYENLNFEVSFFGYLCVSITFALAAVSCEFLFNKMGISYSIYHPVFQRLADNNHVKEIFKPIVDVFSLLTTSFLFTSICSLVPTLAWNKKRESLDNAIKQLAYQISRLLKNSWCVCG